MIQAVIADDSPFFRQLLKEILTESGRVQVIAAATNGQEAVELVKKHKPDVLILDVEMPVMNGLEALRRIMAEAPLPVFMFSALTDESASVMIKALEYGAIDFLTKPKAGAGGSSLDRLTEGLLDTMAHISISTLQRQLCGTTATLARPAACSHSIQHRVIELVAIGSSIGGVHAAIEIIPALPVLSKPILWVQHMRPKLTKSLAERLNSISHMTVKEAENGERIEDGVCYLAEGGTHMRVKRRGSGAYIVSAGTEKDSGHCPSCDVLFDSVAEEFNESAIGVILTGMGNDGAQGLAAMHSQGAYVIGQSEDSCLMYGMAQAAQQAGAVDIELDLEAIADGIVKAGGA